MTVPSQVWMRDGIAGMFHVFKGEILLDTTWIKRVSLISLAWKSTKVF